MPDSLDDLWNKGAKPSLDQLWQTAPAGEGINLGNLDPNIKNTMEGVRGRDPGVDYTKGAPLHVRMLAQAHSPTPGPGGKSEQELYLTKYYGAGNARQDQGGQWLVRDGSTKPWMPVFPSGVMQGMGTLAAAGGAAAPTIAGSIGGGMLGAPAGPAGMVAGAMGGAALAKGGVEGLKAASGTFNKTPGELGIETAVEAGLPAVMQGLPAAGKALTQGASKAIPQALQKFGGVTSESRAVTQSLDRLGVTPPISSVAPSMKVFEYDRRLRNMLMTDPQAAKRMGAVDTRMREVLGRFGVQGPELDRALGQIHSKSEALDATAATAPAIERLYGQERGLRTEASNQFGQARDLLQQQLQTYRTNFTKGIGNLGPDFEKQYTQAEQGFKEHFNRMYGAIDDVAGGQRYVDLQGASDAAHQLIQTMPRQAVPQILQDLAQRDAADTMTFGEAHALRTTLREMSRRDDAALPGQRIGNLRYVERAVNNAIMRPESEVGQEVAGMLRQADTAYGDQVRTFTNGKIHSLVEDVRQGRAPNPDVVANTIIDSDSAAATKQMWDILPGPMQSRVQTAYLKRMFDDVSTQGNDGRWTVDPDKLLKSIRDSKSVHPFISDNSFWKTIESTATNLRALGGDVDITALNQSQLTNPTSGAIRQHLERALGARQALVEQAEQAPGAALVSDNPDLQRLGARWFLTNEARTTEGARRFGVDSPEWQNVQRYSVQEMFKNALRPKGGTGETIYGKAIEDYLNKLSPTQQRLLFGEAARDDIQLLARQARALFPELDEEFGGSLAAAAIKGGFSKGKAGLISSARGYTMSRIAGRIADSPALVRALTGVVRQDPEEGKALLKWVIQGGLDTYIQAQRQTAPGVQQPDPMQFKALEPKPKERAQPNLFQ